MAATPTIWMPTIADADRCRSCELAAYGTAATVAQWQRLLANKSVVALAHGSKPSAVAVARCDSDGWRLLLVAVAPNARRRGIGRQLVELLGETQQLQLRLPETATSSLLFAAAVGFHSERLERDGYGHCDAIHLIRDPE